METKLTIIIPLLLLGQLCWGQENDSVKAELDGLKAEMSNLSKMISEHFGDETQNVSILKANDDLSKVRIVKYINKHYLAQGDVVQIDSIKILTKDGYIV